MWLRAVTQGNPDLRRDGQQQQNVKISGRDAIETTLTNPSPLGGNERIGVYTTFLNSGTLFYYLTVAQETDAEAFADAFQKVASSIRFTDSR